MHRLDPCSPRRLTQGQVLFTNPDKSLNVHFVRSFKHNSVVCCVQFSPDGRFLATGSNRSTQIFDTRSGNNLCVLSDDPGDSQRLSYIRSVCFSPNGKYLATGAEDKKIRIWDIATRRIDRVFQGHQQDVYALTFSSDGQLLVSGSEDQTTRIWNIDTGQHKALSIPKESKDQWGIACVAISPDGRVVATGSGDKSVRLWDVQSGLLLERLMGHKDNVQSIAFTPDGRGLVTASLDHTLKYWDLSPLFRSSQPDAPLRQPYEGGSGEKGCSCTVDFTGHEDYALSVVVSRDSRWVVSGSKDRSIRFWDLRTGKEEVLISGPLNSVLAVDLSPTGGMLATGSGDCEARLWRYKVLR